MSITLSQSDTTQMSQEENTKFNNLFQLCKQ